MSLLGILWAATALAQDKAWPGCEFPYPIAGSAGFANGQAARRTNSHTYAAASALDELAAEHLAFLAEFNTTFGAAQVPVNCLDKAKRGEGDPTPSLIEMPLDVAASNLAFSIPVVGEPGRLNAGVFYSASVTQSTLGFRSAIVPTLITQLYPLTFAPLVGDWQSGGGLNSYSVNWLGGGVVQSPWLTARAGYSGAGGWYVSVDERHTGLFATTSLAEVDVRQVSPWDFLSGGLQRAPLAALAGEAVGERVGATSLFYRDLPFGGSTSTHASTLTPDTSSARLAAPAHSFAKAQHTALAKFPQAPTAALGDTLREVAGDRLKTMHFRQEDIGRVVDVHATYALSPTPQVFDLQLAAHSPGYNTETDRPYYDDDPRWMVRGGLVNLPPLYDLGVEGGRFFSLRGEVTSAQGAYLHVLLNDPEQLALYPFATNALSVRVGIRISEDKLQ